MLAHTASGRPPTTSTAKRTNSAINILLAPVNNGGGLVGTACRLARCTTCRGVLMPLAPCLHCFNRRHQISPNREGGGTARRGHTCDDGQGTTGIDFGQNQFNVLLRSRGGQVARGKAIKCNPERTFKLFFRELYDFLGGGVGQGTLGGVLDSHGVSLSCRFRGTNPIDIWRWAIAGC